MTRACYVAQACPETCDPPCLSFPSTRVHCACLGPHLPRAHTFSSVHFHFLPASVSAAITCFSLAGTFFPDEVPCYPLRLCIGLLRSPCRSCSNCFNCMSCLLPTFCARLCWCLSTTRLVTMDLNPNPECTLNSDSVEPVSLVVQLQCRLPRECLQCSSQEHPSPDP